MGAPVSSGAVDKGGQLTACCRSVCLDSSGRAASERASYFSWLFVIALLDFCKVVRESTTKIPVRMSASCVTPEHHYSV